MASLKKPAASSQPISSPDPVCHQPVINQPLSQQFQRLLADCFSAQHSIHPHLLLALSGGLDSMVLLHLLVQARQKIPFKLTAMHVHHGLSVHADIWAEFCAEQCERWKVPLTMVKVKVDRQAGIGLEAAARQVRYAALTSQPADFIGLAQHQDDQAETLLLQLARGAGAKGLAGMAQHDAKRKLLRPLLNCSRADLMAYAQLYQLPWVEDESNADTRFDRNFVRQQLMPVFKQRYPAITKTLARSADHLAETAALCDDLARLDAKETVENNQVYQTLNLEKIKQLSQVRQVNLLRWWLAQQDLEMPSSAQMQQIVQQLFNAAADASVAIKVAENRYLKRYQQHAYLVETSSKTAALNQIWNGEPEIVLPDQTRLIFTQGVGVGLAMKWLQDVALNIQYRQGGEHLKPANNRPGRSLKCLFNEAGVPPWLRTSWPLLFINKQLVMIPNIAVETSLKAAENEPCLQVSWVDEHGQLVWGL